MIRKAEVVDLVFSIVKFVKKNYSSEASNSEADSSQLITPNAARAAKTSWVLEKEEEFVYPTEVHIWLQEIGFKQSFARKLHGFTDMETMQVCINIYVSMTTILF